MSIDDLLTALDEALRAEARQEHEFNLASIDRMIIEKRLEIACQRFTQFDWNYRFFRTFCQRKRLKGVRTCVDSGVLTTDNINDVVLH